MIELKPTDDQLLQAIKMGQEMGTLRNSISGGSGNTAGFLGEILTAEYLKADHKNTYQYDLILSNGKTIDVKTKRCRSVPKPEYDVSIASYNTKQDTDYYVFTRTKGDYSTVWLLGYIEKELYFKQATERKKGDRDPTNGFLFRADCWNLAIGDLKNIDDLKLKE